MLTSTRLSIFGETATTPFPVALLDLYAKQVADCFNSLPFGVKGTIFTRPATGQCACERLIVNWGTGLISCADATNFSETASRIAQIARDNEGPFALLEILDRQLTSGVSPKLFTDPADRRKLANILATIAQRWRGMGEKGSVSDTENLARRIATQQLRIYASGGNEILALITFSDILYSEERDTQTLTNAIDGISTILLRAEPTAIPANLVTIALTRLRDRASELETDTKVREKATRAMALIAQSTKLPAPPPPPPPRSNTNAWIAAGLALTGIAALFYFTREPNA